MFLQLLVSKRNILWLILLWISFWPILILSLLNWIYFKLVKNPNKTQTSLPVNARKRILITGSDTIQGNFLCGFAENQAKRDLTVYIYNRCINQMCFALILRSFLVISVSMKLFHF